MKISTGSPASHCPWLDSSLSASTRLVQHLSSPESAERAVWIRYALRTMVSSLAQMVFWHALLAAVKTSTLKSGRCGDLQEETVQGLCLSLMQKREKTQVIRGDFFFSTLRSDAHTHFLWTYYFLTGYHLLHLHFWVFTICGYLSGAMGDSVFLDRQNSYLVSTRFIGHKLIIMTWTCTDKAYIFCCSERAHARARPVCKCVCLCEEQRETDFHFLHDFKITLHIESKASLYNW